MRILICIAAAFMLGACCHAETAAPGPEVAPKQAQTDTTDRIGQQVSDAWTDAENEEIVSAIERSDPSKWVRDPARRFVLAKTYDADIHMYMFFRMTISEAGLLFLDGNRRDMSAKHTARLVLFYARVMFARGKP